MSKIQKPAIVASALLILGFYAALMFVSCNNNDKEPSKNRVVIEIPADSSGLDKIDHFMPERTIREYQAAFKTQRERLGRIDSTLSLPDAEAFNKRALLSLLKADDCVGIRIYHGVKTGKTKNEIRLILVGVDSKGKEILISKKSALTAQITDEVGGEEAGQCPSCLVDQ